MALLSAIYSRPHLVNNFELTSIQTRLADVMLNEKISYIAYFVTGCINASFVSMCTGGVEYFDEYLRNKSIWRHFFTIVSVGLFLARSSVIRNQKYLYICHALLQLTTLPDSLYLI